MQFESLEDRILLTFNKAHWATESSFDQFSGGGPSVVAIGYNQDGSENAELLGFDFCRASSCGGSPISLGGFSEGLFGDEYGAEASLSVSGKVGIEYGFYANAGTADLLYDGTLQMSYDEAANGEVDLSTFVDIVSGALFTQSPTVRAFMDLVFVVDGSISGQGCFVRCTSRGSTGFNINERVPLLSINRNADGEIKFIGESLLSEALGTADQINDARKTKQEGERDKYKASRRIATGGSSAEIQQAQQDHAAASQKSQQGSSAENDVRDRAASRASGKKFGGGNIIQISVGEDPSDLLGLELEVGVGIGWKEAVDLSKRLGSFSVTLPDIALTDTTIDGEDRLSVATVQSDSRRDVAKLSLDLGAILGGGYGLGATSVTVGPLSMELTTVSYLLNTSLRVNQQVDAVPKPAEMHLLFTDAATNAPRALNAVVNGSPRNNVTSLIYSPGDDVRLHPIGSQAVKVTPSLKQPANFRNDIGLDVDIAGVLRALAFKLEAFGEELIDTKPLLERHTPLGAFDLGSIFNTDFDVSSSTATFEPFIIGGLRSDLSLSAQSPASAEDGVPIEFPLSLRNDGPNPATGAVISTTLPSELQFNAARSDAGCSAVQQTVTCQVGSLAVGASRTITLAAVPDVFTSQAISITAEASANERDHDPFDNVARARTVAYKSQRIFADISGDFPSGHFLAGCPTSQSSSCSLRAAIEEANSTPVRDVILLTNAFSYTLDYGEILITAPVDIVGPPGARVSANRSRIFRININDPTGTEEDNLVRIRGVSLFDGTGQEGTERKLESVQFNGSEAAFVQDADNRLRGFFVSDYKPGQLVRYRHIGGSPVAGLVNGATYQVINPVAGSGGLNPPTIQLAQVGSATPINLGPATSGNSHFLNPQRFQRESDGKQFWFAGQSTNFHVDGGTDIAGEDFDKIYLPGHDLQVGDKLHYTNEGVGADIVGLKDGTTYYVVEAVIDTGQFKHDYIRLHTSPPVASGAQPHLDVEPTSVVPKPSDGNGGAIYVQGSDDGLLLQSLLIDNSSADGNGGAVSISGGKLSLVDVTLKNNRATSGGAINLAPGSEATLNDVLLADNRALDYGGAIELANATARLSHVTLRGNSAGSEGGGIDNFADGTGQFSEVVLADVEILDNASPVGAGLNTFAQNGGTASVSYQRTVFARNGAGQNIRTASSAGTAASTSLGFNISDDASGPLDGPGDRPDTQLITLSRPTLVANVAGSSVGLVRVQVPFAGVVTRFTVDDPRFEIVSGRLQLKPTESVAPGAGPIPVKITVTDENDETWEQSIDIRVVSTPTAPNNFFAVAATEQAVNLAWDNVAAADEYHVIQRDSQGVEDVIAVLDGGVTSFVVGGLPILSTWSFAVAAANRAGAVRTGFQTVALPVPLPDGAQDVVVDVLSTSHVRLSWKDGRFEDGYRVLRNGVPLAQLPANATTFDVVGLAAGSSHDFAIEAFNASGIRNAAAVHVEMPPPAPTSPSGFQVAALSGTRVRLTWNDAESETSYRIFQSVDGGPLNEVANLADGATSHEIDGLASGSRQRFFVRSVNRTGSGSTIGLEGLLQSSFDVSAVFIPGSGEAVDLGTFGGNLYPNLTTIDIDGNGANRLTLTPQAVVDLTAANDAVEVHAGDDDDVDFGAGWVLGKGVVAKGRFYRVLTNGQAEFRLNRPDHWHNLIDRLDVSNNGEISPIDILLVINELNVPAFSHPLTRKLFDPAAISNFVDRYLDVNGDGFVSPIDALLGINFLNARGLSEGEASNSIWHAPIDAAPATHVSAAMSSGNLRPSIDESAVWIATVRNSSLHETPLDTLDASSFHPRSAFEITGDSHRSVSATAAYGASIAASRTGTADSRRIDAVWRQNRWTSMSPASSQETLDLLDKGPELFGDAPGLLDEAPGLLDEASGRSSDRTLGDLRSYNDSVERFFADLGRKENPSRRPTR